MKHFSLIIMMAFAFCLTSVPTNGQTFSKMPEKQRNAALIKTARAFYKHTKFKTYYKKYGDHCTRAIKEYTMKDYHQYLKVKNDISYIKDKQYIVSFWTKNKRYPAASVYVSDKLGKAWQINFPDNTVVTIWDKYMKE